MWLLDKKPVSIYILHNNNIPFGYQNYPSYCYMQPIQNLDSNILSIYNDTFDFTLCNYSNNLYSKQKFLIL